MQRPCAYWDVTPPSRRAWIWWREPAEGDFSTTASRPPLEMTGREMAGLGGEGRPQPQQTSYLQSR